MTDKSRISGGRKFQVPKGQEGPGAHYVESARDLDRGDDYHNQQSDGGSPPSLSYPQSRSHLQPQVHSLTQQLNVCNEEVAELQPQLEALETFDENSLYGQLQKARLEAHTWPKRAEAAERRGLKEAAFEEAGNLITRGDDDMQARDDPSGAAQTKVAAEDTGGGAGSGADGDASYTEIRPHGYPSIDLAIWLVGRTAGCDLGAVRPPGDREPAGAGR
ncbi:hypothetical protein DL765_010457 [Monosporascus sp. GIB2]|nr:hypothetical protein DL765_010457 [Monosporascus sp. GIB2]